MSVHIGAVTLVVPDYDGAIAYFTRCLDFELVSDAPVTAQKRWVLVRPKGAGSTALLLAKAATPSQTGAIGNQTGGRVFLFLHTDDFARDHARFVANGVHFLEAPRHEPYGTVAVFQDPFGNRWDLLQLKDGTQQASATPA
ncbi:MAG: VOC family protein [Devosia sp.]